MSHCDRILAALRDGEWHTTADIYKATGGFLILHSRVSDLRKKGHNVEGRHVPGQSGADGYEYRLVEATQVRQPVDPTPPWAPAAEQLSLHVAPSHYDI